MDAMVPGTSLTEAGFALPSQEPEPEEAPLSMPDLATIAPAVLDGPMVTRNDGKQTQLKDVMKSAYNLEAGQDLQTRVDLRDVSLGLTVGKAPTFSFLHRNPVRPMEIKLLQGISFSLLPGETTVLIGGPRSGKSSLLDVIAGRRTQGVSGQITINGAPPGAAYQRMVSYVVQGDDHAPLLTVKETLEFAAWLQMPTDDPDKINRRVDAVLQLLGLKHAANTIVGDWAHRGVSGGEKRRCTIGIEWVKGPKFFLLDEPTTGLDSGAAMNVGRCLRAISELGTPVLCALLQPSWELIGMFDKILIIAEGQVAYWGPVDWAIKYFADLGFHCPQNYSAAEFLSELVDHPEKFEQDKESAPMKVTCSSDFLKAWRESELQKRMLTNPPLRGGGAVAMDAPVDAPPSPPPLNKNGRSVFKLAEGRTATEVFARSYWVQTKLLLWRGMCLYKRSTESLLQLLLANAVVGLLMGLLFFNRGNTYADSSALFGLIFFCIARLAFNALAVIPGQFADRPYFIRQRAACYYQMLPYAWSNIILDIPLQLIQVIVYIIFVYWLSGLARMAGPFFFFLLTVCCQGITFVTFARIFSVIAPDPLAASLFASTICVVFVIYSGFLIIRHRLPKWWLWLHYLSPLKYASDALVINEFLHKKLTCAPEELYPPTGYPTLSATYPAGFSGVQVCAITTGKQMLSSRDIAADTGHMWLEFCIILIFFVVFCIIYYVALRLFKWPPAVRAAGGVPGGAAVKTPVPAKEKHADSSHAATLSWSALKYTVPLPTGGQADLLTDINGYVAPGMLLALMGPSGAGKTTLLDVLAARKNVGVVTGNIRLDGKPVNSSYPRVIGYVEQFDMHYPLQTVEEAFLFAAKSRLPAGLTDHRKQEIVDGVINLLEMDALRPALVAGLNPEEQKRLAMGVELVSQPSVLFLDEPTSGLDSNGADRVMSAIEKVAKSGTSIICTIHQPSSRIFLKATHLLLLRKGGHVVYLGELGPQCNTLMSYFGRYGVAAPLGMNPADFVLEIALGNYKNFAVAPTAAPTPVAPASPLLEDGKEKKKKKKEKKEQLEVIEKIAPSTNAAITTSALDEEALKDLSGAWNKSAEARQVKERLTQIEGGQVAKKNDDEVYITSLKREYALKWPAQFMLLMGRWSRSITRTPEGMVIAVVRGLFIGFLLGTTFWRRPHDQQGATELAAVIWMAAVNSFLTAFAYIPAFFIQRAIFYRERAERMYRVSSWGLSRAIMDLPSVIVGNLIVAILVYWIAGLRSDAGAFFYFLLISVSFGCVALAFAQMLTAVFASIDVAGLVFASVFAIYALSAGFLIPRTHIRVWMRWIHWSSYLRYYLEPLLVSEFKSDTFRCSDLGGTGFPVPILAPNNTLVYQHYCPITRGDQILDRLGAYKSLQYYDFLALVGYWVGFLLIFLLCLRVFIHQKR